MPDGWLKRSNGDDQLTHLEGTSFDYDDVGNQTDRGSDTYTYDAVGVGLGDCLVCVVQGSAARHSASARYSTDTKMG
ncbi:MAG: hypothetical protein WD379_06490 [Dehalococcoidia bacterium]